MNIDPKPKWELAGEPKIDAKTAKLEAAPETERWDPVPGSTGHQAPANASVDEDDGGRSTNEQLVEKGIEEAEQDRARQSRESDK